MKTPEQTMLRTFPYKILLYVRYMHVNLYDRSHLKYFSFFWKIKFNFQNNTVEFQIRIYTSYECIRVVIIIIKSNTFCQCYKLGLPNYTFYFINNLCANLLLHTIRWFSYSLAFISCLYVPIHIITPTYLFSSIYVLIYAYAIHSLHYNSKHPIPYDVNINCHAFWICA